MKSLLKDFSASFQIAFAYLAGLVSIFLPKRASYIKRVVIDIASGAVLEKETVPYSGKFAVAMPNGRPFDLKSFDQLKSSISPIMGDNERIPWVWYHRQTYTDNSTTQLTFFNATGVLTTTNMQAAGQIPAPMYFTVYHVGIWFDFIAFATQYIDIAGLVDGIASFQIAQKTYFQAPIWMLPAGGGVDGQTAIATDSTARNGVADLRNRYMFWGDLVIPHNQNFSVVLDWAAAVNIAANVDIIVVMDGFLHRRIL